MGQVTTPPPLTVTDNRYAHNMALTLARIWSTYTRDHIDQMHMATATREPQAEVEMLEQDEGVGIWGQDVARHDGRPLEGQSWA